MYESTLYSNVLLAQVNRISLCLPYLGAAQSLLRQTPVLGLHVQVLVQPLCEAVVCIHSVIVVEKSRKQSKEHKKFFSDVK